uniref:Geranylgeranyl pyrophosphate synthase vniC n=1 Tax=Virgaria nigra TaxID=1085564 RepID=VNIC_VIRNI
MTTPVACFINSHHQNSVAAMKMPVLPEKADGELFVSDPLEHGDLGKSVAFFSNRQSASLATQNGHSPPFTSIQPEGSRLLSPCKPNQLENGTLRSSPSILPLSPLPDPSRYAQDGFPCRRSWTTEKENAVRGPFDYITAHPGKDFRALLISAFNAWLDVPSQSLEIITRVVGMLHESSLLIDDVQDSSELRRGFPVAHHIFGVAQTINSANYIYFAAFQELLKLNNPSKAISIFAEQLVNLHRGQGMDLIWRDTLTCPSEDDYLEMVDNKTGGLFRLGIELMQAESASNSAIDCIPLVNLIGLIYQIRDDYMNLSSQQYSKDKGMYEDLTEGKFSFPIIHSINADPTDRTLISILKQKTTDVEVKRYAVRYIEGTGSFQYVREVLKTLIERAKRTAQEIDQGRGKLKGIYMILDRLAVQ